MKLEKTISNFLLVKYLFMPQLALFSASKSLELWEFSSKNSFTKHIVTDCIARARQLTLTNIFAAESFSNCMYRVKQRKGIKLFSF